MLKREQWSKYGSGFTLIELLVVVTIVGLVLSGGMVAYNRFDQKQKVIASGRELMLTLREAQKKAKSGEKPTDCATLTGWQVRGAALDEYHLAAVCGVNLYADEQKLLAAGVVFSNSNFSVTFAPVTGLVTQSGSLELTDSGGGNAYTIEVSAAGAVGEVGSLGATPLPSDPSPTPTPSGPPQGFNQTQCPTYQSSCELYTDKCSHTGTGCDLADYWCYLWSFCQ